MANVISVVVTYFPDVDALRLLVEELLDQTAVVFIVDNTDVDDDRVCEAFFRHTCFGEKLILCRLRGNNGIATALNVGIDAAIESGATHVLLSDQDSLPHSGMVSGLLRCEAELVRQGRRVAAIGATYFDEVMGIKFPFLVQEKGAFFYAPKCASGVEPIVETVALITSGCLIRSNAFLDIGLMREELFIEYVDFEWCLRARSQGYSVFGTEYGQIQHHRGEVLLRVWRLGWRSFTGYSPLRLYYRFRNYVYILRLKHVPTRWGLYEGCHCLGALYAHAFFGFAKRKSMMAFCIGVLHGLLGKMGRANF